MLSSLLTKKSPSVTSTTQGSSTGVSTANSAKANKTSTIDFSLVSSESAIKNDDLALHCTMSPVEDFAPKRREQKANAKKQHPSDTQECRRCQ